MIPDPGNLNSLNPLDIASELSQKDEGPEARPFLISFARYNRKECSIDDGIDNKVAKKALRAIRDVGVEISSLVDFPKNLPKLKIEPVNPGGDYSKLFNGLDDIDDLELKELKIDSSDSRLFFFAIEPQKIFYIVAIKDSHLDTSKTK